MIECRYDAITQSDHFDPPPRRSVRLDLQLKGRAASTRQKYRAALREFERWGDDRGPAELTGQDIQLFLSDWASNFTDRYGRSPSPATQKSLITALRSFYDYADRFDFLVGPDGMAAKNPMSAIDSPTVPQKANDWLHTEEDQVFLEAPSTPAEEIVVWLLRWTGLRMSEARNLRWSDLDFTAAPCPRLIVLQSKTPAGKRTLPIFPSLHPRLWRDHLEAEGLYWPTGPVLVTRTYKADAAQLHRANRKASRIPRRCPPSRMQLWLEHDQLPHPRLRPDCKRRAPLRDLSPHAAPHFRLLPPQQWSQDRSRLQATRPHQHQDHSEAYAELLDQKTVLNDLAQTLGWAA